jgi:hypothetical protein
VKLGLLVPLEKQGLKGRRGQLVPPGRRVTKVFQGQKEIKDCREYRDRKDRKDCLESKDRKVLQANALVLLLWKPIPRSAWPSQPQLMK